MNRVLGRTLGVFWGFLCLVGPALAEDIALPLLDDVFDSVPGPGSSVILPEELLEAEKMLGAGPDVARDVTRLGDSQAKDVYQAAVSFGAQHGLSRRYAEIVSWLSKPAVSERLDRIFAFQALLIDGRVVPPVVVEAVDQVDTDASGQSSRRSGAVIRIVSEARITGEPPNWRNYLVRRFDPPTTPAALLAVLDKKFLEVWRKGVVEGYVNGRRQAERIYLEGLARLQRDFIGMVRFLALYRQGLITMPKLNEGRLGLVVNGRELRVDERTVVLDRAEFVLRPERWRPPAQVSGDKREASRE